MREEPTIGTNGQRPGWLVIAKVTVGINVRRTQQVRVVIEECILELGVWFVGMQFFEEVGGRKGQLASQ